MPSPRRDRDLDQLSGTTDRIVRHPPCDAIVTAMLTVVNGSGDVPTVRAWSRLVGRSETSMYAVFRLAGVPPKACLDLARLMRAALAATDRKGYSLFDVADPRTVQRLLQRSGLPRGLFTAMSLADLLNQQTLLTDERNSALSE